jgi:hypothetical protein
MMFPDISGKWNFTATNLGYSTEGIKPSFSDIKTVSLVLTVEQNNQFVIITMPAHATRPNPGYRMGVFTKVYYKPKKYYWLLSTVDDDDDGRCNITISKMKHGKPYKLSGHYVESGFSTMNSYQKPMIDSQKWTKIL